MLFADSATRAPGVLVEARNSTGDLAGRALTDATGRFTIVVQRGGAYEVRALRIGFRPTIASGSATAQAEAATRLRIVLGSVQVSLATVRVRADDECRVRADSGQLVAQVWEMARTALASAQASEDDQRIRATGLVYKAWRETSGQGSQWQEFSINDALTARPFVSAPAEQLAREGYSSGDSTGATFVGPDPEALISDAFAGAHCFQLSASDAANPGTIGVRFRPVRDRRGVVDITGTFLLDRETGALRSLDYRYTNVPPELARGGAGGHIEYHRLATGDWVVRRWSIRLPTVLDHEMVTKTIFAGGRLQGATQRDQGAPWIDVSGGELIAATAATKELFADSGVVWRGVVRSDGRAADEATVEVPEPGLFAIADSAGTVELLHASAGVRDALISSRPMRLLGLPPIRRKITLRDSGTVPLEVIDLLGDDQILSVKCGKDALARNRAVLFGVARGFDGAPLKRDSLFVRWLRPDEATSEEALAKAEVQVVRTDGFGRWIVCTVPRGGRVLITPDEEGRKPLQAVTLTIARNARLVEADVEWTFRR